MHQVKEARYAPYRDELERENVRYMPLVWSAFGRPHSQTVLVLRRLAKKGARRRGFQSADQLLRRANAKIGVELWRRAARMVMQCLPRFREEGEEAEEEEPRETDAAYPLGKAEPPAPIRAPAADAAARAAVATTTGR
jgi:hypothetical protein